MPTFRFMRRHFLPLLVVMIFFSALVPKLFNPGFSSSDDPYYHAAHARAYWQGESLKFPTFTPLSDHAADPWYLYHWTLAPFVGFIDVDSEQWNTIGSEVYHALLATVLFGVLFYAIREHAATMTPLSYTRFATQTGLSLKKPLLMTTSGVAILGVVLVLISSHTFIHRTIFIERPHILMIILVLVSLVAIFNRRYWLLFLAGVLAAVSYSFSPLVLIPSAALFGAWLLLSRKLTLLWFATVPLALSIAGLFTGILIHHDSYGYAVNGILIHLYAIIHALFWWTGGAAKDILPPGEMLLLQTPPSLIHMFLATAVAFAFWYRSRGDSSLEQSKLYLIESAVFLTAVGFTVVQFIIPRAAEYSAPFTAMAVATLFGHYLYPLMLDMHARYRDRVGEIGDIYRSVAKLIIDLGAEKKLQLAIGVLIITAFASSVFLLHVGMILKIELSEYEQYRGAAEYLTATENHLVLYQQFNYYAPLIFLAPQNTYATGMDSRFIYLYNSELALEAERFWKQEEGCADSWCQIESKSVPPTFILNGVTHLLVDENILTDETMEFIAVNRALEQVYVDPTFSHVKIYRIVAEPS